MKSNTLTSAFLVALFIVSGSTYYSLFEKTQFHMSDSEAEINLEEDDYCIWKRNVEDIIEVEDVNYRWLYDAGFSIEQAALIISLGMAEEEL